MGSLSPPSILLTTSNEASQECVTIWDPIAGNSIARLSGEQASRSRICLINGRLLVVPAAKKPLLLIWDLQTAAATHKKIVLKGIATAICSSPDGVYLFLAIHGDIFIYQLCSGCLIGVLPNGHTGSIGELCLPFWSCHMPLLLVSADASGFLSCWDLGSLGEFNLVIKSDPEFSSRSLKHDSPATNSALWYAAQVSRGLPRLGSYRDNIIVAGTEGLKFFASRTGVVTRQKSFECPLHSLAVKEFSRLLFLGGDNGILFVTTLSNSSGDNLLVRRRCFVESSLSSAQKSIIELALSPYDQGMLVVGAKAGLVEILRTDTLLTRLQRFSVLHSITGSLCSSLGTVSVSADVDLYTNSATTSRTDPHCLLTLRFAPVPNWMAGSTPLIAPGCNQEARVCGGWPAMSTMNAAQPATKSDTDLRSEVPDSSIGIEQFKRYSGWQLSDVIHVKLHKLSKTPLSIREADLYLDDFYLPEIPYLPSSSDSQPPKDNIVNTSRQSNGHRPAIIDKPLGSGTIEVTEVSQLRDHIDRLERANRNLLLRLVGRDLKQ